MTAILAVFGREQKIRGVSEIAARPSIPVFSAADLCTRHGGPCSVWPSSLTPASRLETGMETDAFLLAHRSTVVLTEVPR